MNGNYMDNFKYEMLYCRNCVYATKDFRSSTFLVNSCDNSAFFQLMH